MREQVNMPYGVVQPSRKYKIVVRSWAELVGDAEHRMKFVQDALQYESSRDSESRTFTINTASIFQKCRLLKAKLAPERRRFASSLSYPCLSENP